MKILIILIPFFVVSVFFLGYGMGKLDSEKLGKRGLKGAIWGTLSFMVIFYSGMYFYYHKYTLTEIIAGILFGLLLIVSIISGFLVGRKKSKKRI